MANMLPTHNLVVSTSTYEKDGVKKYRNFNLGVLFTKEDGNLTIRLSDIATNILKLALGDNFEGWVNVFENKNTGGSNNDDPF